MRHISAMFRALVLFLILAGPVEAATLLVGPDRPLKLPSAAAAAVQDGDTVQIDPGEYFDCAIWAHDRLTIEGMGAGATVTDKTCEGKAVFILRGNDITVRGVTLARARVLDGNGAGIRVEGRSATIERSRFVNNQAGLQANGIAGSVVTITDSAFVQNGACSGGRCASALQVGAIETLRVTGTNFSDPRGGDHIVSQAATTVLSTVHLEDGDGVSRYLVEIPSGEIVSVENSVFEKGPHSTEPATAILLGEGAFAAGATLRFTGDRFVNHTGASSRFIVNWTSETPVLSGNQVAPGDTEATSGGAWTHRARGIAAGLRDRVRWVLGQLHRVARAIL